MLRLGIHRFVCALRGRDTSFKRSQAPENPGKERTVNRGFVHVEEDVGAYALIYQIARRSVLCVIYIALIWLPSSNLFLSKCSWAHGSNARTTESLGR